MADSCSSGGNCTSPDSIVQTSSPVKRLKIRAGAHLVRRVGIFGNSSAVLSVRICHNPSLSIVDLRRETLVSLQQPPHGSGKAKDDAMQLNAAVRIGSDVRWLLGGEVMMKSLLQQHLSAADAGESLMDACQTAIASRQVAIRQAIADGIEKSLSPGQAGGRRREEIRRRIEDITGLSSDQSNRILNGVGQFSGQDGEIKTDTVELAGRYFERDKGYAKELSLEFVYLLALGASESSHCFTLPPYQFAANVAAAALRLRVSRIDKKTEFESLEEIRTRFPRLQSGSEINAESAITTLSPFARMALYGLYMWQAGSVVFDTDSSGTQTESGLLTDAVDRTIRWAPTEAPWVFPELIQKSPAERNAFRSSPEYRSVVEKAVLGVGACVGQALLGIPPFTRALREGLHHAK